MSSTYGKLDRSALTNRYGGSSDVWITDSLERIQSYGFNTVSEYGHTDSWPGGTWSGLPIQMPFVPNDERHQGRRTSPRQLRQLHPADQGHLKGVDFDDPKPTVEGWHAQSSTLFDPECFSGVSAHEVGNLTISFQWSNFKNYWYSLGDYDPGRRH